MDDRLHKTAAVGNAAALIVLVLIAASAPRLFHHRSPHAGPPSRPAAKPAAAPSQGTARALVLVVIDGLRADTAFDPQRMPVLNQLADRESGNRTTAQVESLLPCSVAGIVALVSGQVLPPASFVSDFRADRRREGGILEAVRHRGGTVFVAGPILWTDLYGPWITAAEVDETFGQADRRLLSATLRAVGEDPPRLAVVHLSRPDAVAHRYGTQTHQYHDAVRWCDEAVGQLVEAMEPGTALLVTSDHGNTERGGHAGPEPSVLTTPLVTFGPGFPGSMPSQLPQTSIPAIAAAALGVPLPAHLSPRHEASRLSRYGFWVILLPVPVALLCGLRIGSGVSGVASGWRHAFVLNAAVWGAVVLMWAGRFSAATALCLAALAGVALCIPPGVSAAVVAAVVAAGAFGGVLATLRLADGFLLLAHPATTGTAIASTMLVLTAGAVARFSATPALSCSGVLSRFRAAITGNRLATRADTAFRGALRSGGLAVLIGGCLAAMLAHFHGLVLFLVAFLGGRLAARWLKFNRSRDSGHAFSPMRPDTAGGLKCIAGGSLTAFVLMLLYRISSGSVSLSSLDVSLAASLLEWRAPVVAAVFTVIAAQAIPAAGLLIGLRRWLVSASSSAVAHYAAGVAAVVVGQTTAGLVLLHQTSSQAAASLAMGLALRVTAEALYLFLGLGLLLLLSQPPRRTADAPTACGPHTSV